MQKNRNMKQTSLKYNEPSNIKEYIEAHIKEIQDFEQRPIDWTIRGKKLLKRQNNILGLLMQ